MGGQVHPESAVFQDKRHEKGRHHCSQSGETSVSGYRLRHACLLCVYSGLVINMARDETRELFLQHNFYPIPMQMPFQNCGPKCSLLPALCDCLC